MSKRLAFLEQTTASGSKDPFAWYGLALEYRSLQRLVDALRTFETLKAMAPDYVPMYLMAGNLLETMGRKNEARNWYEAGKVAARIKGDAHALSELESAIQAAVA